MQSIRGPSEAAKGLAPISAVNLLAFLRAIGNRFVEGDLPLAVLTAARKLDLKQIRKPLWCFYPLYLATAHIVYTVDQSHPSA